MLSRIAESLFWIGRYIERTDGTARILDVHLQLLLEDPWIDEDTACRSLLSVMGVSAEEAGVGDAELSRSDVLRILALNREQPGSISHSIGAARENARRAREIVSSELWEALNTTYAVMPWSVNPQKNSEFFRWVRERSALAVGIVDASSSRDDAWQFFTLGRALERADMVARLLATRSLTEASGPSWTTILRSVGAYEAYLRTYRAIPSTHNAAEFLLVDRLFPRSILYSITQAIECLGVVNPDTARAGRRGIRDRAVHVLGRIESDLGYRSVTDTLEDLPRYMEMVQAATSEASEAIRQRYFPTNALPSWTGELA